MGYGEPGVRKLGEAVFQEEKGPSGDAEHCAGK